MTVCRCGKMGLLHWDWGSLSLNLQQEEGSRNGSEDASARIPISFVNFEKPLKVEAAQSRGPSEPQHPSYEELFDKLSADKRMLRGCPHSCLLTSVWMKSQLRTVRVLLLEYLSSTTSLLSRLTNTLRSTSWTNSQSGVGTGGGDVVCYLDVNSHPECCLASEEEDEEGEEGGEEGGAGEEGAAAGEEGEGESEETNQEDGQAEGGEAGGGGEALQHCQPQPGQADEEPRDEDQQVDGADGGLQ